MPTTKPKASKPETNGHRVRDSFIKVKNLAREEKEKFTRRDKTRIILTLRKATCLLAEDGIQTKPPE